MQYIAPKFKAESFTCPHCNTLAYFTWGEHRFQEDVNIGLSGGEYSNTFIARCCACGRKSIWIDNDFVYPCESFPVPNPDMPKCILDLYNEAGEIHTKSPRAACALLRLAIERLCNELGESGNIDNSIKNLVKRGLPETIQKALDVVRVVGNKAVHIGKIDLDVDDINTAKQLFALTNMITSKMISEPQQIDALFGTLPDSIKIAIKNRDRK